LSLCLTIFNVFQGVDLTEKTYIAVKKSQVRHYKKTPLFKKNLEDAFVLYKPENDEIDVKRFAEERYPQLYISGEHQEAAIQELHKQLKSKLMAAISSGELNAIKLSLIEIVQEALEETAGHNLPMLPETIDIIYNTYSETANLLKRLIDIQYGGYSIVEHSVNVMVYTLNYCLFCDFGEILTKRLSLAALAHDIGLAKIPVKIVSLDRKLTEKEFEIYKTHPAIGHDIIKQNESFDPSIAVSVLEHHEYLNGNGYPRGIANLSFEGQVIALIDTFDNLISSAKAHRNIKNPFEAMNLIKTEIIKEGRFNKKIFKDLCLSFAEKSGLSKAAAGNGR
jgi:HD-GYP domain-containing protein (c-di-GMP phosphodiesterase class II)